MTLAAQPQPSIPQEHDSERRGMATHDNVGCPTLTIDTTRHRRWATAKWKRQPEQTPAASIGNPTTNHPTAGWTPQRRRTPGQRKGLATPQPGKPPRGGDATTTSTSPAQRRGWPPPRRGQLPHHGVGMPQRRTPAQWNGWQPPDEENHPTAGWTHRRRRTPGRRRGLVTPQ